MYWACMFLLIDGLAKTKTLRGGITHLFLGVFVIARPGNRKSYKWNVSWCQAEAIYLFAAITLFFPIIIVLIWARCPWSDTGCGAIIADLIYSCCEASLHNSTMIAVDDNLPSKYDPLMRFFCRGCCQDLLHTSHHIDDRSGKFEYTSTSS